MPTETNANRVGPPTEPVWDNLPILRQALYEIETEIELQFTSLEHDPDFRDRCEANLDEAEPRHLYAELWRIVREADLLKLARDRTEPPVIEGTDALDSTPAPLLPAAAMSAIDWVDICARVDDVSADPEWWRHPALSEARRLLGAAKYIRGRREREILGCSASGASLPDPTAYYRGLAARIRTGQYEGLDMHVEHDRARLIPALRRIEAAIQAEVAALAQDPEFSPGLSPDDTVALVAELHVCLLERAKYVDQYNEILGLPAEDEDED